MRIAHVIRSLDPAGGGPPMVATRLATAQVRLGHEVTLVAGEGPSPTPDDWLPQLPGPRPDVRAGALDLAAVVADYDVLHLHGVWDRVLYRTAAAARRRGTPYVVAPHGMLDPWSLAQKRWKKTLALALGYRAMLNRAAALHLLNDDELRLLAPLGLKAPGVVLPNGVFLEEIDLPPPAALSDMLPNLAGRPYVLFISRLHYKKGLDYLADAFHLVAARRPDACLVVAGPDGGARADFERRTSGPKLAGRVFLTGPLYGAAKWAALAGAACFCLPSRQEGFSVAILEAMACRTPAVVSEACHFPEVREVGAGAVVELDAGRIADAMDAFLGDADARRRAGAAGRQLVEARYTWPKVAAQSLDLYRSLAPKTGRPAGV
jgi:glycosyltransferase involved in cell wall biosynthesis